MKSGNLTQSEWEIMKVLWDKSYLTSGQIYKEICTEYQWAKTTVNSFIQRLLEKKYIDYRHDNRYREYYTTKTEKECVTMKMSELTRSIYGCSLICETEYFEFYGKRSPEFIEVLTQNADDSYRRITNMLGYEAEEKQAVHLHKTQKRFHSVLGTPNAPKWLRASFIWGMIHMSPLDTFTDITADKALMHVFTQLCISNINENCPYYIHQGISAYLSQWLDSDRIKEALSHNSKNFSLNALRSFVFDVQNFRSSSGYELSFAFISYIVSKFDLTSLRLMIDNPYDLPKLFNMDEEIMVNEFRDYINNTYLK